MVVVIEVAIQKTENLYERLEQKEEKQAQSTFIGLTTKEVLAN